jgi:ADYC domain
MHLMRHTNAGALTADGHIAYPTTTAQRQAMLKMLTADYCGTGRSFTVDGQALKYGDSGVWYPATPTSARQTDRPHRSTRIAADAPTKRAGGGAHRMSCAPR